MKRKGIYAAVCIGCIAIISGARLYHKNLTTGSGVLGNEVVFFGTVASTQASTAAATPTPTAADEAAETDEPSAAEETDAAETATEEPQATAQAYEKIKSSGKVQIYDSGVAVLDDTAYELYNYVSSTASRYAKAVNRLTKKVSSSVTVYDMIVPTSVGITFPDNKKSKLNSSDQETALSSIEGMLSGREVFIPLYDQMMQHRTEYLYFRTDHHWTSLGAYYAYQAFCEAKGITANDVSDYETEAVKGFLGSFYRETDGNENLKTDTMYVMYPLGENISMKYTTTDGDKISAPVIADAQNYSATLKYCAYIAGDNPYTVIQNDDITDGSSCVVIKESYGNAFVPFLADHYQTVYVIDYRYWEGNLTGFIKKKKLREVILINNISMTRNAYLVGKLAGVIG